MNAIISKNSCWKRLQLVDSLIFSQIMLNVHVVHKFLFYIICNRIFLYEKEIFGRMRRVPEPRSVFRRIITIQVMVHPNVLKRLYCQQEAQHFLA